MKELQDILYKYQQGKATKEEIVFVELYYQHFGHEPALSASMTEAERAENEQSNWQRLLASLDQQAPGKAASVHRIHFLRTAWFRYAAVLLLIAGTATFLYLNKQPQQEITLKKTPAQQDIAPGGNKAILTLADGSTIVLDNSVAIGNLAIQGNTKIIKLDAGALAYQTGTGIDEVMYNTISTPKGGQYQITLPDGTKVWLNAASSIKFPTAFGKDRKVSITGEVYFETASDKSKPFSVLAGGTEVQVLGTHFNINAYTNEPAVKTTLLEGRVRVNNSSQQTILLPDEQAVISGTDAPITVNKVDRDEVMAWKNGAFNFNDASLKDVMKQLERWYDIEVVYEKGVPDIHFVGKMSRDESLASLLKGLEASKVRFRIEQGRRLVVMP